MPDSPTETVALIYDGWARGDFEAGLEHFDSDVVYVLRPDLPDAGTYEGLEGLRRYTLGFLESWERVTIGLEWQQQEGDRILARVNQRGTGRGSGAEVGIDYFHVWTFRDGRVLRLESIQHEAEAREAMRAAD